MNLESLDAATLQRIDHATGQKLPARRSKHAPQSPESPPHKKTKTDTKQHTPTSTDKGKQAEKRSSTHQHTTTTTTTTNQADNQPPKTKRSKSKGTHKTATKTKQDETEKEGEKAEEEGEKAEEEGEKAEEEKKAGVDPKKHKTGRRQEKSKDSAATLAVEAEKSGKKTQYSLRSHPSKVVNVDELDEISNDSDFHPSSDDDSDESPIFDGLNIGVTQEEEFGKDAEGEQEQEEGEEEQMEEPEERLDPPERLRKVSQPELPVVVVEVSGKLDRYGY